MDTQLLSKDCHCKPKGPKYIVCIEDEEYPWDKNTISYEEIVELGGWDAALGVIEIDKCNNERTLQPGEIVELRPGHGFAKKICWRRGLTAPEERIQQELVLLRTSYPDLQYVPDGQWVFIPRYATDSGWSHSLTDIAFQIPLTGYPATPPYGFHVRSGIRFNNQVPSNYREPAPSKPPFDGDWGMFSWQPEAAQWKPKSSIAAGANLLNWVKGFAQRFKEGK
ncbi:MAG TPA: hypothetical protein ENJ84_01570 [Gammaproteobacteria bacterium]|nr:hypothetical protein [Gammaproteobacteria bacterium]